MWARPCRRSAERGASMIALQTYDWLVTSPMPVRPRSVWILTTRTSWVPSAISATSGRRRWIASTSVIFMGTASASVATISSMEIGLRADRECAELLDEFGERGDGGLEPELALFAGRKGRVADRGRVRG